MSTLVIGVDPGQTTGVCSFLVTDPGKVFGVIAVQIHNQDGAGVLAYVEGRLAGLHPSTGTVLSVEKFVVSTRAAHSSNAHAGEVTRRLVAELMILDVNYSLSRPAVEVKAWATDLRLMKAGLYAPERGMPHARDAARHALFAAVKAGVLPDPLSKAWAQPVSVDGCQRGNPAIHGPHE